MTTAVPAMPGLTLASIGQGFWRLLPLSMFVVVFGLAYGLAAVQTGLSPVQIVFMSFAVFAGTAQFAALELWGNQIPVFPLLVTTFAINARLLLMGASLYPWLKQVPAGQRYGSLLVMSDANWAMTLNDCQQGKPNLGMLVGGGVAIWVTWMGGTLLGMTFGNLIANPALFGLDMVMGCFMLSMVFGGRKSLRIVVVWCVAALTGWLAYIYLPENTHVVVGAVGGGLVGLFWLDQQPAKPQEASES
ncbi:AzlC family ABC transporter permease [Saccharospirillum impatiens]|uniref:AzlC family ABC transporter permease n=1 Tax=Saccharospirillum impatiens TaxID=169438 RepID=UPI000402DE54|nr:AzlC family ABC transporter permease [Saccharospirillum impatiens]